MFYRVFFFLFLPLLLLLLWFSTNVTTTREDKKEYRELFYSKKAPPPTSLQERQKVRKDLWLSKGGTRLHHIIQSASSQISVHNDKSTIRLVEHLKPVNALFQESLYTKQGAPYQQLRRLHAQEGTYHYDTQKFLAENVQFSEHELEGEKIPSSLKNSTQLLSGNAQSATLHFKDEKMQFQAKKVKATIFGVKKNHHERE